MGVKISNIRYFIITIDTEADNAWSSPDKIEMKNFKEIPRFQELCEKYYIIPTYLLTYEYATYQPAIDYLKPKAHQGKCEIGHHLHIWTTPPFQNEKNGVDMDWLHAYQYELPDDLFYKKADSLYDIIVKNFGIKPKSHRAGRWGIDERSINWLVGKNFFVDSSIVPKVDYSQNKGKNQGGPNFVSKKDWPYVWQTKKGKTILESPVSVYYKSGIILKLFNHFNHKLLNKIKNRITPTIIFRPNPSISLNSLQKIINKNPDYLHFMLHSSELSLNSSPFTKTNEAYLKVWEQIEFMLKTVSYHGYRSICLSDLNKIFIKRKSQSNVS